jgi:hypothetical protein
MLGRGTTGTPLRLTLTGMKAWYRLNELAPQGSGDTRDIRAKLNPEGSAGRPYTPSSAELREIIREAVIAFFGDKSVAQEAARFEEEAGVYANNPDVETDDIANVPHAPHGAGIPGAALHMLNRGANIPRGQMDYTMGEDRQRITERHFRPRARAGQPPRPFDPRNAFVMEAASYPEINQRTKGINERLEKNPEGVGFNSETLSALDATQIGDPRIARTIRAFLRTGKWPDELTDDERNMLGRVTWLMYVRESARDPENAALAPMTMDLIAEGRMSFEEAFAEFEPDPAQQPPPPPASRKPKEAKDGKRKRRRKPKLIPRRTGGRGRYPASMAGATRATRGLEAEDRGERLLTAAEEGRILTERVRGTVGPLRESQRQHGTADERRELEFRKLDVTGRWIVMKLESAGNVWGETRQNIVDYVTEFIRRHHGIR